MTEKFVLELVHELVPLALALIALYRAEHANERAKRNTRDITHIANGSVAELPSRKEGGHPNG